MILGGWVFLMREVTLYLGLADYSKVDVLKMWNEPVNFGAGMNLIAQNE